MFTFVNCLRRVNFSLLEDVKFRKLDSKFAYWANLEQIILDFTQLNVLYKWRFRSSLPNSNSIINSCTPLIGYLHIETCFLLLLLKVLFSVPSVVNFSITSLFLIYIVFAEFANFNQFLNYFNDGHHVRNHFVTEPKDFFACYFRSRDHC